MAGKHCERHVEGIVTTTITERVISITTDLVSVMWQLDPQLGDSQNKVLGKRTGQDSEREKHKLHYLGSRMNKGKAITVVRQGVYWSRKKLSVAGI